MNTKKLSATGCILSAMLICLPDASAAKQAEVKLSELNAGGQKLLTRYADDLKTLQAEITKAMPAVSEPKNAAFMKACAAETAAAEVAGKAQKAASSKNAKNKDELAKTLKSAQDALTAVQAEAQAAAKDLFAELEPFLTSDKLDARLIKCVVLVDSTSQGLAEFAQQGSEQQALVNQLLGDAALMKEMLVAGGAREGRYGQAMRIYSDIRKASAKANEGYLQKLALATALEHAVPIEQSNPEDQPNAPAIVDPVKRYLHYEKASLAGELDPAFKDFSAWEYRMVVNCDAPDETLAWGREMLRNYRPDDIRTSNRGWRYSILVKSDVLYGSGDVSKDLPSQQKYQNIVMNGGVCGRRAFFGRFILRSFGIPVWGVTQHAHAALSRWTPNGWVVNLGAAFKWSWWDHEKTARSGTDFLLETQARKVPLDYLKVQRAQWIGTILGEPQFNDRTSIPGGLWSAAAHYEALAIAAASNAVELGPVGQDVAESNESKEVDKVETAAIPEAETKVVTGPDGSLTVPAAGVSLPKKNTVTILAMRSFSGGTQLHCARDLKADLQFEYTFDAPQAGKYALTANVVTVQTGQKLSVTANDSKESAEIALPYTGGKWEPSAPVEISLAKGRNVLHFTRPAPGRGVSIKEFTLKPLR